MYVELHAHSAFSFLDGASTPMELAAAAAAHGYPAAALTDHDGLWGSMEFAQACKDFGVRPITGAELTLQGDRHITLLVEDEVGYRNLCRLLTLAHSHTRDNTPRTQTQPWATFEQVEEHAEGLVCLSGCARDGAVAGAFERGDTAEGERLARRLLAAFGRDRFRIELQRPYWRRDRARNRWLALLAERLDVPCLATGNVHSHDRRRAPAQDALVAIGLGETLEESEPRRRGNSTSALTSPGAMAARFAEYPEAVAETARVAEGPRFGLTGQRGYPPHRPARLPLPRQRGPRRGRRARPRLQPPLRRALQRQRPPARGAVAAGGGAGDHPQARPLRLLPPPPRPARAGPRGRRRGARPRVGARRAA